MKLISVRVIPKASSNRLGETRSLPNGEAQLTVYVTAVAEKGKANDAIIKLLADHFKLAPSKFSIIKGVTSRHKLIKIDED